MNYDLRYYSRVYTNFLDRVECEDTISQIKDVEFEQHKFYNHGTGEMAPASGEDELDFFCDFNADKVEKTSLLIDRLWGAIKQYQQNLDLPWFDSWEAYSSIKYNRYTENKKMAIHVDHIKSLFEGKHRGVPILTCLGLLNDDYTGGDFLLCDEKVDLKQGDLLIFPSNFMYPHQVKPIKSGTRYSYISWVW